MFAKERMGFMPALCVAFLEELTDQEKAHYEALKCQRARAEMVLSHPFVAEKFGQLQVTDMKNNGRSVAAREEGNRHFQEGGYQVTGGTGTSGLSAGGTRPVQRGRQVR